MGESVKVIATADEFKTAIATGDKDLAVIDWYATWCGPCRAMAPKVTAYADKYKNVGFYKIDVDELEDLSAEQGITAMPTFQLWVKGSKVKEFKGANAVTLEELIKEHGGKAE
eukprot:TRINITY_DN103700_c0_g1_i1.p1 TRINITY_DN103700_c0_g1~~TRINITY_DN103700_c0_g1_i1.p1  ORF type:complete len:124 (-),score=23.36 TRINITY_DN103700_c0_g1_i1:154-492(-)